MAAPLISVLMPVFNGAGTLRRALDSIRCQTFPDWELVLVDDGSTDATPALAATYAQGDPRVRCLHFPHHGIVAALNVGLEHARGQFVARMDVDDESHPARFAEQAAFLAAHPEIGLAGSLVEFGGNRAQAAGYALHVDWMNSLLSPEEIELNRFVESPFAHPSVMFRRQLVSHHGGYRDGHFPEDYELWLRWLDAGVRMAKVPKAHLVWHDPPHRLSRTHPRYDPDAFYRVKACYLARWLRRHVSPDRPIWVWGAGRPTRKRAEHLAGHGVSISGYIDVDRRKQGRDLAGRRVWAPEAIPPPDEVFVVGYVAKRGARELARAHLQARGFVEGGHFLMAS